MEVYALVGPAGTGKSHRAIVVAHDYQIDAIIDDGLLIQGSRILAGESAKREATKMAAVRRAIFADPAHRAEVRQALEQARPSRVLILGTSDDMIRHITKALGLPDPVRTLRIEEIATPDEIRQARRVRRQQGKHVVPAPTFEVKKSFSGYLIDPLRLLYRPSHARGDVMIEKSVVRPTFSWLGRFFIAANVVAAIAERAASEVEGCEQVGRVFVQSNSKGVAVELELSVRYGLPIAHVLREVQRHVRQVIEYMTALNVLRVDVTAKGLVLPSAATPRSERSSQPQAADTREEFDYNGREASTEREVPR
ncbi:MAG TPA: Asp23/Gls24 family envelope stress response protein [Bacillota bacterium]